MECENYLLAQHQKKGVLIAAHRGNCSKKLADNTIPAFANALKCGADILETDVFSSTDGELFLFHTTMEPYVLREQVDLRTMSSAQIRKWKLYNSLGEQTEQHIDTLEAALQFAKDRCILNLDRCDDIFGQVVKLVRKHKMQSQVFLKSVPTEENLQRMKCEAADFMYMPIQRYTLDGLENAQSMGLNMVGIELTYDDEEMVSEKRMNAWKEKGYILLSNALNFSGRSLNAVHDDNISIGGRPEDGWGWLVRRGFGIIQTDYTDKLSAYLCRR